MSAPTGSLTVARAQAASGLVPVDAHALLAHVTGRNRAWLIAHADDVLAADQASAFMQLAQRRRAGEPVAYLVGRREFHGLDLAVTPAVLIPRPETETLVEMALARIPIGAAVSVLDLGTGSGAIALAIASARPAARVLAIDRSADALAVARGNAARLQLHNVEFAEGHWYAGVAGARFDMIVSNPPYIADGDPHLADGDVRFEPRVALTPGGDGLGAFRVIVTEAPRHLSARGHLLVEHGYDQAQAVQQLFAAAGFTDVSSQRDLAGIPRAVAGVHGLGSDSTGV